MLKETIDQVTEEITPRLIELRRDLHAHPELAFEETRTAEVVARELRRLGIEPREKIGRTGVVGVLEGGRPGRTVGVRADLDALPVTEATGLAFASQNHGKMHACGHDVHTVIALGVAEVLSRAAPDLAGRIKFIFQPAEETLMGAKAMIDDGVLEGPAMDMILGYHNSPQLEAGVIGYHETVCLASSDAFDITVRGRAGHAAHPHTAIDAIVGAGHLVTMLQTVISREIAPIVPAVITIGQIQGGTARNVIAESVTVKGGVRALDADASGQVEAAMRRIVAGLCQSLRLEHDFTWTRMTPVLRNDPAVLGPVLDAVRAILGPDKVVSLGPPSMGSEDFAWFAERIPAAHFRIGSKIPGLDTMVHRANYDSNDLAIPAGVRAVAHAAASLLQA
jgi:amidohydrolase